MLAIYFDEDSLEEGCIAAARGQGFDCETTLDADRLESPDDEQLHYATAAGRVILTRNYDDFTSCTQPG